MIEKTNYNKNGGTSMSLKVCSADVYDAMTIIEKHDLDHKYDEELAELKIAYNSLGWRLDRNNQIWANRVLQEVRNNFDVLWA